MKKTNIALFILAGILAIANLLQGQTITYDTTFNNASVVISIQEKLDDKLVERRTYYKTGELWVLQEFDPRTGLQHGDEYWYFRNSEVEHACKFVNGMAHGYAFDWDAHGNATNARLFVENREVPVDDYEKYFADKGSE